MESDRCSARRSGFCYYALRAKSGRDQIEGSAKEFEWNSFAGPFLSYRNFELKCSPPAVGLSTFGHGDPVITASRRRNLIFVVTVGRHVLFIGRSRRSLDADRDEVLDRFSGQRLPLLNVNDIGLVRSIAIEGAGYDFARSPACKYDPCRALSGRGGHENRQEDRGQGGDQKLSHQFIVHSFSFFEGKCRWLFALFRSFFIHRIIDLRDLIDPLLCFRV